MHEEFINPNWHVILVHYPLALLTMGVLVELFSFLWPRSSVRLAARWMLLLGALAALPTATTGIYALYDAVREASTRPDAGWQEMARYARWGNIQWTFMLRHMLLASVGSGVMVLCAIAYLAFSERLRDKLRLPLLALMTLALATLGVAAWYAGEGVYRAGVAVAPGNPAATQPVAAGAKSDESEGNPTLQKIQKYLPPAQVHVLVVGLALAMILTAVGLTFRRWSVLRSIDPYATVNPDNPNAIPPVEPVHIRSSEAPDLTTPVDAPAIFPARFWLLSSLAGVLAAAGGVWLLMHGSFDVEELKLEIWEPLRMAFSREWRTMGDHHFRLAAHTVLGTLLILLPLLLAIITRWSRRAKIPVVILMLLVLAAAGLQVWVGVLLMYGL